MSLVTRQYGPDAKGSKLTNLDMDNNLYYLQSIGVSGLTFSSSTLTLTNPTGGTLSVTINDYYTTGATYSDGLIYFDRNDQLSAYTVNISSLTGDSNTFITAFTYTSSANTLTLTDNINNSFNAYIDSVSGLTVTGSLSATTLYGDGSNLTGISTQDTFVTGGTYSNGSAIFTNNTGGTFNVSGFYTGLTDNNQFTTGFTYSSNTFTILDNSGNTFNATINAVTGLTVNGGLSATTISATTYQNLPIDPDTYVTGFTYSLNTFTISDNSGSTFNSTINLVTGLTINGDISITGNTNVNGLTANTISATTYLNLPTISLNYLPLSGGTVSGNTIFTQNLTANTISATTYQNLPLSGYGTGLTFNTANYNLTIDGGNGVLDTVSLSVLASDLTVTGGTYNPNTGIAVFTNNTGGTFNVTGFLTGLTDTYVSGSTYSNNTFTFTNTSGGSFNVNFNTVTGLTSTGTISSNTISATTYQNLPTDVRVTGGTYSAGTTTFTNNTGGTFSITGFSTGYAYSQTNNYTSGIPVSITHNFGTTEVLVQIIDTNTNQQIFGNISNYQLNSFDVTLNSSLNGIKVVVVGGSLTSTTPRGSITLLFGHNSVSPSDSVSYFIGGQFNLAPITSTSDGRRLITQKTGNITQVSISRTIGGTLGSSELNTFSINNVTQSTTRIITSAATFDSSSSLINYTITSPLPVVDGDKLEIEWDTPAYATNPTSVRQQINVLIDF